MGLRICSIYWLSKTRRCQMLIKICFNITAVYIWRLANYTCSNMAGTDVLQPQGHAGPPRTVQQTDPRLPPWGWQRRTFKSCDLNSVGGHLNVSGHQRINAGKIKAVLMQTDGRCRDICSSIFIHGDSKASTGKAAKSQDKDVWQQGRYGFTGPSHKI